MNKEYTEYEIKKLEEERIYYKNLYIKEKSESIVLRNYINTINEEKISLENEIKNIKCLTPGGRKKIVGGLVIKPISHYLTHF